MRVLIAGIDGYLGWSLAQYMAARGHTVGGIDAYYRRKWVEEVNSQSAIPIFKMSERLKAFKKKWGVTPYFKKGDLTNYDFVKNVFAEFNPETIVHLGECPSAPYSMIDVNHATWDAVIIMDDDLQDPPEFIPELINIWKEGYDIVYAVRTKRKESLIKRIGYNLFYRLLNGLSENRIPKNAGDFSILDRKVVDILRKMPEIERFNRGLRSWIGFKQIGVTCEREARYMGQPAYNLRKTIKLALDGIVSFSNFPLRIASIVGFIVSTLSFFGFLFTLFQKFISIYYPNNPISVWEGFSTIVLSVLFLGGVQLLMIGILGEYIGRIFIEVKNRPKYIVQEKININ